MSGQTITEKIAQSHMTEGPERPLRCGDVVSLRPRHVMTHDNTSAVISKFLSLGAKKIFDPRQPVFPIDHDIQNTSEANLAKYKKIEAFAQEHGIDFYPPGTGISHQIMVSQGYVVPGSLVVGSDSHSNMYGALGALGTPVVRTDAAAIWATGQFWWQIPRTVKVILNGKLRKHVTGKDVIITLCGLYNQEEVLNAVVEFSGSGIKTLSMDERMTIANMTTEWGALAGWFPVDEVTVNYLKTLHEGYIIKTHSRFSGGDLKNWLTNPPQPDADAVYAATITLDLDQVSPYVSGPDTVQVMGSLSELSKKKIAINKAYLVSCVNSRLEDIEAAASVIKGQKVKTGVGFYIAAASAAIQRQAEQSGAWKTLLDAGASPLPSGCGPCIGLGTGLLEPGEVGISATNRNFKGRMGSRDARTYLASPAVVAASAVAGYITGPAEVEDRGFTHQFVTHEQKSPQGEVVAIQSGFPQTLKGRLVLVPQPNLNTDGIYGKEYTYKEDIPREQMAQVVMNNYDPRFAGLIKPGDILVATNNFGTGSSREQAATALQAAGIALVMANSFSQTYLRNAYNNGFICIECPDLVNHVLQLFTHEIKMGVLTMIPEDLLEINFAQSAASYRGFMANFAPLGSVPQKLVIFGGIENQIRAQLSAPS